MVGKEKNRDCMRILLHVLKVYLTGAKEGGKIESREEERGGEGENGLKRARRK